MADNLDVPQQLENNLLGGLTQAAPQAARPNYAQTAISNTATRKSDYDIAKEKLENTYAARSVEGEDAARWAAMAKGFAAPAGSFWESLANAGANVGAVNAQQAADVNARQREMAKLEYEHQTKLLQNRDALERALGTAQLRGTGLDGSKARPVKLADGSWGTWENGQITPISTSKQAVLENEYRKAVVLGSKVLDTTDLKELDRFAQDQVAKSAQVLQLGTLSAPPPQAGAAPVAPPTEDGVELPSTPTYAGSQQEIDQLIAMRNKMPPGADREAAGHFIAENLKTLRASTALAPTAQLKSAETEAEKTARGGERGKANEQWFQKQQEAGEAAQSLTGSLNLMENLYTKYGENIPAGAAAPAVTAIKSGLSTFGIKFEGAAPADALQALSVKGALQSRTADGQNLLPGAMSNYEDQLLQKTFPTLAMTHEGRLLQIQIMKAQLQMKTELAQAARDYYTQNGKIDNQFRNTVAQEIAAKNPFLNQKRIDAVEVYAKRLAERK